MADGSLPTARSALIPGETDRVRRLAIRSGRAGLANDTKWDELITAMRARIEWRPNFRWKCLDGSPSRWETEWFYHLPFPMASVEWCDIAYQQEIHHGRPHVIDHSRWMVDLLSRVGLDYQVGSTMVRIFGYAPRSLELFDQ